MDFLSKNNNNKRKCTALLVFKLKYSTIYVIFLLLCNQQQLNTKL